MNPGKANSSTGPLRDSLGGDPLGRFRSESAPGELQVIVRLAIHPELGCGAEEEAEPERGVRADTASIVDDLRNAVGRDPERSRQLRLGVKLIFRLMGLSPRISRSRRTAAVTR
jgi:hypothetical protein